jgi:hypothetical protein
MKVLKGSDLRLVLVGLTKLIKCPPTENIFQGQRSKWKAPPTAGPGENILKHMFKEVGGYMFHCR